MPITEALKKLIKTITGKNAVGETIEELVQNLNDNYPEGSGGGGDEYETVAEIAVGTMEEQGGVYTFLSENVNAPDIVEGEIYYLNEQSVKSDGVLLSDAGSFIGFNFDLDTEEPIDPLKPWWLFAWETGNFALSADNKTLENTTVKILKKVSGGGSITVDSELSETSENPVQNKVITAALGGLKPTYEFGFTVTTGQTEDELIVTPDSGSTYAAIAAALAETPNVYAVLDLGFQNQIIRALFSNDSTASGAESTYAYAMIWNGTKWMGARLIVSASGADILFREL